LDLGGQVAIVTGGAKPEGIGHAVALGLAREGARVAIADLYEEGFDGCRQAIAGCLCIRADVRDQPSVERMVGQVANEWGRIDVLVNAVGGSWAITPEDLNQRRDPALPFIGVSTCSLDEWHTILEVNLYSAFYAARAVAPYMQRARSGRIVNFSSVAARKGVRPGTEGSSGPYAVAKAGIIGLTKQLAIELAPYGVTANAVAPGVIMSWRGRTMLAGLPAEERAAVEQSIPFGRFGTTEEVAGLVVALCTREMSYVTGATIDVNGAMYSA
jgi:NAD(P)-dependent dehydrogenase (short-subunit alcohol dehydrogenase family)